MTSARASFACRAHPRAGGENLSVSAMKRQPPGSSPRGRGKLAHAYASNTPSRLIPARAGKTLSLSFCVGTGRAHPRSRGENGPCADSAGRRGAHPRSRGENHTRAHPRYRVIGSSPLTRGKRPRAALTPQAGRLIPAHAGKTVCYCAAWTGRRAHPRSRGENSGKSADSSFALGSSPLTRGKRQCTFEGLITRRLIPAHAGKTGLRHSLRAGYRAHPRSRGENVVDRKPQMSMTGSSPLTRGKPSARHSMLTALRLIPAHAGKTSPPHSRLGRSQAHPRSRGENKYRGVTTW